MTDPFSLAYFGFLLINGVSSICGLFRGTAPAPGITITNTQQNYPPYSQQNSSHTVIRYGTYTTGIVSGILYAKLVYLMRNAQSSIEATTGLAAWKNNVSLEALLSMNQDTLHKDLMQDAKALFCDEVDFMLSDTTFLKLRIQEEILMRKRYMDLYKKLERFHVTQLFFVKKECYTKAKEQVLKLAFMRKLID